MPPTQFILPDGWVYFYKNRDNEGLLFPPVPASNKRRRERGRSVQLNITTDYAIRMVCLLGDGSTKTLDEISKETKVPRSYVGKIVKRLKRGGLLGSAVGAGGGVFLRKELCNISLYEIFCITEVSMKLNRCLEDDAYCSRNKAATCPVRKYYQCLQEKLEKEFLVSLEAVCNGIQNDAVGAEKNHRLYGEKDMSKQERQGCFSPKAKTEKYPAERNG